MDISRILAQKWVVPTATGVAGIACGFGAGYFLGRRNNKPTQEITITTEDVVDVDSNNFTINPEDVVDIDPNKFRIPADEYFKMVEEKEEPDADDVAEVFGKENYVNYNDPDAVIEPIVEEPVTQQVNVFTTSSSDWDEEAEAAQRMPGEPYVIPVDVFVADEMDFSQETLTYYEGDDTLADQSDQPIYNYSNLLGELKFGHGSGDPNVVYIRNETIRREWEVLRHTGQFAIEVLGHTIEAQYEEGDIKHSSERKFRSD